MKNRVILLVEDSRDDVELMLRVLRENNISSKVEVVKGVEQALDFSLFIEAVRRIAVYWLMWNEQIHYDSC